MRIYTPFAMLPIEFASELLEGLPAAAFKLYLAAYVQAVKHRCELLPAVIGLKELAVRAGLDLRTARKSAAFLQQTCSKFAASLQQKCLLEINPDGRIKVYGVRDNHQKLAGWKADDGALERPIPSGELKSRDKESTLKSSNSRSKPPAADEPAAGGRPQIHKPDSTRRPTTLPGIPMLGPPVRARRRRPGVDVVKATNLLLAQASSTLIPDALAVVRMVTTDILSVKVVERAQAELAKCPRQFCLKLWYARHGDNPAATFTDLLKRERITGECDEARHWAETMCGERPSKRARTG